uniref:Signal peptide peptidase like 2A n=1 Tax=Cercocebus atys TaxID=9531 RepID=A0A2K5N319_CERAT
GQQRRLSPAEAALLWGFLLPLTATQEAILHASGNGTSKDYCMLYNPHWSALPNTLENATYISLMNLTSTPLCNLSDVPLNKAVVVQWGSAEAMLVVNNSILFPTSGNRSEFPDVKMLIAFISHKDFKDMKETRGKKGRISNFYPLTVVIFVVMCCVMMVLLYFFYKWLIYVMIAIFCITSAMSLYNSLAALIHKTPYGQCTIVCRGKTIVIVWAVFRNEDRWAWILQDTLGIAFCLNLIKTLKLPSFKSCVILLGLLLLYDVFFVFITPFITKNGESSMVELAAGLFGNTETLPVVIRVPKLICFSVMSVCIMPVSILGFGDSTGLLIAYCRRVDVHTGSSYIDYVSSTAAYAIGMILTFVVLVLMKKGQPALLYLVPCTLITASVVAWKRKEMKKFWKGNSYQMMDHLDYATNDVW